MAMRYRSESGRLLSMITALAQRHPSFQQLYRDSYRNYYPLFGALPREMRPGLPDDEIAMPARLINGLVEGSAFQIDVGDVDAFVDRVRDEAEAIALAE